MKQNIKNRLTAMYQSAPPIPDEDGITSIIKEANKCKRVLPKESSLLWFVKMQLRFINIKVWLLQLLLLCFYAFFVFFILQDMDGFLLLVPITPIVVLIGNSELSRSFRYHMVELEIPTRFSLRQVLLARLLIIVVADVFTLTCILILTALRTYTAIHALILYGLVPCLVTAYGSLFIMNRYNGSYNHYYTTIFCIVLSVVGGISIEFWPAWYHTSALGIWIVAFFISLAGVSYEVWNLLHASSKKLECLHSL